MTRRHRSAPLVLALLGALVASSAHAARFTYHGELLDGDAPADGRYDLRLRAFAQPGARAPLGDPLELPAVAVVDGRFSVELDLPEDADGTTWVEVAVREAGGTGDFAVLGAPQPVSKANSTCPGAWALDGNTGVPVGSFLGLADAASNTALVLAARNTAVAVFTPRGTGSDHGDAPSVALGAPFNQASAAGATVGGGGATRLGGAICLTCTNVAGNVFATVAGGRGNDGNGDFASVGGGEDNRALDTHAVVGGGAGNVASESYATVGGGIFNTANGSAATVAGGSLNCAGGDNSWAGGNRAIVRPRVGAGVASSACAPGGNTGDPNGDEGSFAWGDNQSVNLITTAPNQFLVRAQGGVAINTAPLDGSVELTVQSDADDGDFASLWLKQKGNANGVLLSAGDGSGANNAAFYIDHFTGAAQARRLELAANGAVTIRSNITGANSGVSMAAGAGSWSMLSDRRLKTAIEAVDGGAILERLLATPISTWSYLAQGEGIRHIGPMAQDFAAAFALGENDTSISTVDANGVALAAIQGLNAKLERENAQLRDALAALTQAQAALAARLQQLESAPPR